MANEIKKVIVVEGDTKNAIEDINKLQEELKNAGIDSKVNENKLIIDLDTKNSKEQLEKVNSELKNLNVNTKTSIADASKFTEVNKLSADSVTKNGGAMAILDRLTGGLAMQFKDAYEASSLFNGSLGKMKSALVATGIGALVVALGLIVVYWEDIKGFITGANAELDKQIEKTIELNEKSKYEVELLNSSDATLKRQGKTQKEINKLKIEANEKVLEQLKNEIKLEKQRLQALINLQKEGGSTLEQFLRTYNILFQAIYGFIDKALSKIGVDLGLKDVIASIQDTVIDGIFGTEEDIEEKKKRLAELELEAVKTQNTIDGLKTSNDDIDNEAAQKQFEKEREAAEKLNEFKKQAAEIEKQNRLDSLQAIEDAENEFFQSKLDRQTAEENAVRDKYFNLIEAARKYGEETKILEEAQQAALKEIKDRYEAEEKEKKGKEEQDKIDAFNVDIENEELSFAERKQRLDDQELAITNSLNLSEEERTEAFKQNSEARKALAEAEGESRMEIASAVSNTLSSLSQIAGEQTALGKGLAVASATIETIQSAVSSYNSLSGIPIVGPALGAVAAAAAVASGYANVKKILSVKVPGNSGGAGAGGASAPPPTPQFNTVGKSSSNQLAETIGKKQNEPVKAYVVSSDVTTGQSLDRNRINNSTFL